MKFKLYFVGLVLWAAGAAIIAFAALTDNLWGFFPLLLGMTLFALGFAFPGDWRKLR